MSVANRYDLSKNTVEELECQLNPKQREWLEVYISTGNASEAIRQTYGATKVVSVSALASHNKNLPIVKKILSLRLTGSYMTIDQIKSALREEIFDKPSKTGTERGVRLKAIDTFLKLEGHFNKKEPNSKEKYDFAIDMGKDEEELGDTNGDHGIETPPVPETDTTIDQTGSSGGEWNSSGKNAGGSDVDSPEDIEVPEGELPGSGPELQNP